MVPFQRRDLGGHMWGEAVSECGGAASKMAPGTPPLPQYSCACINPPSLAN